MTKISNKRIAKSYRTPESNGKDKAKCTGSRKSSLLVTFLFFSPLALKEDAPEQLKHYRLGQRDIDRNSNLARVSSVIAASRSALNAVASFSRERLSPSATCSYSNPIRHNKESSKN